MPARQQNNALLLWVVTGLLTLGHALYAWFSYALTAPNLILTQWAPYWQFQQYMWETYFNNRPLLTQTYALLITLLWVGYGIWMWAAHEASLSWKQLLISFVCLSFPFLLANNNLSYDVFNYIFNAKMVMVYHQDPHVNVALDYPSDPWVWFMHNTHTPAPYAYGWTALSLIPYMAGLGKFLLTWVAFRLWSFLGLGLLGLVYFSQRRHVSPLAAAAVLLNPLTLTEILANSHNDLWMMVPALASLALLLPYSTKRASWNILALSLVLLLASTTIKFATFLLLPVWFLLATMPVLPQKLQFLASKLYPYWPLLASSAMFIPLMTSRAQQFHPWYFMWCLVWLPFTAQSKMPKVMKAIELGILVGFSISSTYRYLPYLWHGDFLPGVLFLQKQITWIGGSILTLLFSGIFIVRSKNND
jgi:hypothetical protein